MSKELLFWFLMILWLLFGLWSHYEEGKTYPYRFGAFYFLLFVLMAILGWAQFGAPVKP